ncbi:MAG: fatty acid hydroxylase family protein [Gammaproteobacteria bacterium]
MELTETAMSDRQRGYREIYRQRIATWYNGYLHVAIIYTIGLGALYVYASHLVSPVWWEWLTVPLVLFMCNLFEWWIHRHVMHRPHQWRGARAIYTRHMLMHHQFFTDTEMRFAGQLDWRVTFFPPYALIVFILMSTPAALLAGWLVSANVGWLLIASTTSVYLLYEFMHFCCHVGDNAFMRHCPFVNTIRRHHRAHHNQSIMMERNMNLTFPIADWLFGTSDLNRGLIGHLFNGYDETHVKGDMRTTSRTPRVDPGVSVAGAAGSGASA